MMGVFERDKTTAFLLSTKFGMSTLEYWTHNRATSGKSPANKKIPDGIMGLLESYKHKKEINRRTG